MIKAKLEQREALHSNKHSNCENDSSECGLSVWLFHAHMSREEKEKEAGIII